jgi:branched-chain amino acid transport system substrate-binding protein
MTEKLITDDKVKFILGPYGSGITLATSAIGEKYKVLTVACQANASNIYERGFKYIISILPPATYYLRPVVDLALKVNPKVETAAVIWADDAFPEYCGKGARDYVLEKKIKLVYEGKYPKDAKDLSSILVEAKNKNPDMLLGGTYFTTALITKQMKTQFQREAPRDVGGLIAAYVKFETDKDQIMGCEYGLILPWKDDFFGTSANYAQMMGSVSMCRATIPSASVAGYVLPLAIEKVSTRWTKAGDPPDIK